MTQDFRPSHRQDGLPFPATGGPWEECAFPFSATHPPSCTPFPGSVLTGVQALVPGHGRKGSLVLQPRVGAGRGVRVSAGEWPRLAAQTELLAWRGWGGEERTRPAPEKRPHLPTVRPGGGVTN